MDTEVSFKIAKTGKLNGYDKRNEGWHIRRGKYYRAVKKERRGSSLISKACSPKDEFKKQKDESSIMEHVCQPSTEEAAVGDSQVQGQPRLHSRTLSQKRKKNTNKNKTHSAK